MSVEVECKECGAEFDARYGDCPVCKMACSCTDHDPQSCLNGEGQRYCHCECHKTEEAETKATPDTWADPDSPTDAEADAYLRGEGIIKKCEVCGQDATLTNEFVAHLAKRHAEVCAQLREAQGEVDQLKGKL